MLILFRELVCCTELCVLHEKVIEVAIISVVVTCNSFEVLI